ncbi:MAG TPA: PLP-dependent aminotransferase family protein [Steroidobacteraceae bacterium]|nr:PLP-dependent aminotransferase family protein [Steroidobacteraceae bacterium]
MLDFHLSIPQDTRPSYLRIAEGLRQAIQSGRLKPGERLPSCRRLAVMLAVHRHTVSAAADELVAEGWLKGGERRAHRVAAVLPSEFFRTRASRSAPRSPRTLRWRVVRNVGAIRVGLDSSQRYRYAFAGGVPDLRLFPYDEFRTCVAQALRKAPTGLGGYGDPAGHPEFIERLSLYLRRVRALTGRRILVTHGSQEGMYLVAQLLLQPGDKVAMDELGFPPAWEAFRAAGADLVPVKLDARGMVPEALEAALGREPIRLIYLTSHHQYPTTVTLPAERRLRIYELASRHGVPIIEDDYDHEFHFRSHPIAPLASNDPCELVIYTSTLSKVMLPSMRLGFLAVPERIYQPLVSLRTIMTRQNNIFLQDAVARWIDSGGFERHLRRMRRVYQERRDTLVDALTAGRRAGLPLEWTVPDGGMALWLSCGVNTDAVAREAGRRKVFVQPESRYRFAAGAGTHLRLGYASQTPQEIRAGMEDVLEAIASVRG